MHWKHLAGMLWVLFFASILIGCMSGSSSNPADQGPPVIVLQPASQKVTTGQSATFTVQANGAEPLRYQWQKNGADISGATSRFYIASPSVLADDGGQFQVTISNSLGSVTSDVVTVSVSLGVATYHNDNMRTGQNLDETILTLTNVNPTQFGKIGFFPVDGRVDGQPLYLSQVDIPNQGTFNVLYVVTEHDSVYAFDADSGVVLWQKSVLRSGETPSDDRNCHAVTPEIGITSTPVIDLNRGPHGAIYLVAMSENDQKGYSQRLHALDLATGEELFNGPVEIQGSFPGTGENNMNGKVVFDPRQYMDRASLLLLDGKIYTSFASHCDIHPYTGWIIAYDASTLMQSSVFNVTPNGSCGAVWMSGGGPAADNAGNIYLLDGNGTFDTTLDAQGFPSQHDFGNTFLKLSTAGGISVADYFEQYNWAEVDAKDYDLGSGGALLLPDLQDESGRVRHLAIGAGKDAAIYVVDRDHMGKYNDSHNDIYQELPTILPHFQFSTPAYFNNTLYFGPAVGNVEAFTIQDARLSQMPTQQGYRSLPYPGSTPAISANKLSNGILWTHENYQDFGILRAYDATNLSNELYGSDLAPGGRDQFGPGNKFVTPTVANGKVYLGTTNGVAVFGLLPN